MQSEKSHIRQLIFIDMFVCLTCDTTTKRATMRPHILLDNQFTHQTLKNQTNRSNFKGQESLDWVSWPSKMRPICCPETSVRNYHYSLRNKPQERSSHLLRGRSLKSRIIKPRLHKATYSVLHVIHKPSPDSAVIRNIKLSLVCIVLSPLTRIINFEERQWKFCVLHNVGHQFMILLGKQAQAACVAQWLQRTQCCLACYVSSIHTENCYITRDVRIFETLRRARVTIVAVEKQQYYIILTPVPCAFHYFVQWPTNAQLIYKLLYRFYVFRKCCVILRELVVSTLPSYTSMSRQLFVIQLVGQCTK
jgi:hypothetical protein